MEFNTQHGFQDFSNAASASPVINRIQLVNATGDCVLPGKRFKLVGTNFGTGQGLSVVIANNIKGYITTEIIRWRESDIVVEVPKVKNPQDRQTFRVAIYDNQTAQYISNTEKKVTVCQYPAPETNVSQQKSNLANEENTAQSSQPTGFLTQAQPIAELPISEGTLLDSSLPPPPPEVVASTVKESKNVEPGEIIAVSASMKEAQEMASKLRGSGFRVIRRKSLKGLGLVVSVIRIPKQQTVEQALKSIRQLLPKQWIDANHRYEPLGKMSDVKRWGMELIGWANHSPESCGKGLRIGLIDSGLDLNHSTLKNRDIEAKSFVTSGVTEANLKHGTATAAILIGRDSKIDIMGLLPAAKLFAAAVFRKQSDDKIDTTAEWVVYALDWLAQQQVSVINMSLGGPRNLTMEAAIKRLRAKKAVIVAAAGNSGPDADPVYPAAHKEVIGVTAVDAKLKPYRKANRGNYISFAAPGVDIWTAKAGGGGLFLSGTSYAAPYVTATIAGTKIMQPNLSWEHAVNKVRTAARDLGDVGKDTTFGWGLVTSKSPCSAI